MNTHLEYVFLIDYLLLWMPPFFLWEYSLLQLTLPDINIATSTILPIMLVLYIVPCSLIFNWSMI